MRRSILVLALFLSIVSLGPAFSADVPTILDVPNTPPYIIQNFSDIFLIGNTNSTNFLDLDDYFGEDNGDTLNITYTELDNIAITIDSEHRVSFYPDMGYTGQQFLQFSVADDIGNVTGNLFQVTVGEDNIAPKWFNPTKSRTNVYQNFVVNFTTSWTDNLGLESFIFSINQGSGWVNSSVTSMTGTANISTVGTIISASPATTVSWMFYATDLYGNTNATDIQQFEVQEFSYTGDDSQGDTDDSSSSELSSLLYSPESATTEASTSNFKIDVSSIKLSLRQGDTVTKTIRVTNIGNTPLDFTTDISSIESLAIISDDAFYLEPGETKELIIDFKIPDEIMPDQYFGNLKIAADEAIRIPIILDVRAFESEISVTVFIPEKYKTVKAGKEARAIVTIVSTKDLREANLSVFYAIKNFKGDILESNNTELELFSSTEDVFALTVPKETPQGEYLFYVRATGENLIDIGSDTFFIGIRFRIMRFLQKLLYPLLFIIFIMIIIVLFIIYKKNKDKQKALELYIMLNELRSLVKAGKTEEAIKIYKRIKVTYGQHIPNDFNKNSDKLKLELDKFAKLLKQNPIKIAPPPKPNSPTPQAQPKPIATQLKPAPPAQPVQPPKPTTPIKKVIPSVTTLPKPTSQITKPSTSPQPKPTPPAQPVQPSKPIPPIKKVTPPIPKPTTPTPQAQPKPTIPPKTVPVKTQENKPIKKTKDEK